MNLFELRMRGAPPLSVGWIAAAAMLGAAAGLMSVFDAPIAHAFDWLRFAQQAPFAPSLLVLLTVVALVPVVALAVRHRAVLWRDQFALAIAATVMSFQLMAVDVGPLNSLNVMIVLTCTIWLLHRFVDHASPWNPSGLFHLTVLFMACVLTSGFNQTFSDVVRGWITLMPKLVLVLV